MEHETTESLKNEILSLSKLTRTGLDKKVERFMKLYERQKKNHEILLQHSDKQQKELKALQKGLEERVEAEMKARAEKERMLEQQAKMAAMGEMMDAVAHQWKQPLNALTMLVDLLKGDYRDGLVDDAYLDEMTQTFEQQIDHMVTTLNEFRTFFRPNKAPEPFGLKRCLQSVMLLVKDEFMKHGITIHTPSEREVIVTGIENEFKHLILNIINNAKDAFNERGCRQRDITIRFEKGDAEVRIEIEDNAGGIPESVIGDIFQPNVTTKAEGKGTGIGLYMSTQIARKLGGTLGVYNTSGGACFHLTIPA